MYTLKDTPVTDSNDSIFDCCSLEREKIELEDKVAALEKSFGKWAVFTW